MHDDDTAAIIEDGDTVRLAAGIGRAVSRSRKARAGNTC
jgi:hypothetical protein